MHIPFCGQSLSQGRWIGYARRGESDASPLVVRWKVFKVSLTGVKRWSRDGGVTSSSLGWLLKGQGDVFRLSDRYRWR